MARVVLCLLAVMLSTGCAVHYYDAKSGTEHLWGFGHLKMRATEPQDGVRAVVKGTESFGLSLSLGQDDYRLGLGWDYRRRIQVDNNSAVRIDWPDADFFNVRVGDAFPPLPTSTQP